MLLFHSAAVIYSRSRCRSHSRSRPNPRTYSRSAQFTSIMDPHQDLLIWIDNSLHRDLKADTNDSCG